LTKVLTKITKVSGLVVIIISIVFILTYVLSVELSNLNGQLGLISFYIFGIPFFVAVWEWVMWYKGTSKVTNK